MSVFFSDSVTVTDVGGPELVSAPAGSSDHALVDPVTGVPPFLVSNSEDSIDVGANSITYSFDARPAPIAFVATFSDLEWIDPSGVEVPGELVDVVLVAGTIFGPFARFVIGEVDGDAVLDVFINPGSPSGFTVNLVTDHAVIPIPAALPLFASALIGFGVIGYRRRKT